MKACTIRKTNISSEFCALVIQKKNYCLLAADLDHNLLWLSPDCLAQIFKRKPLPCSQQRYAGTVRVGAGSGEVNLLWVPLTMAACLICTDLFSKCCLNLRLVSVGGLVHFQLEVYALSLSAAACFGNICPKINLRP